MAKPAGSRWNADPDRAIDRGRRQIMLGAAALAAAVPFAALPTDAVATDPRSFVRALGRQHWDRAVELTALRNIHPDRGIALRLLWAALEHDLDPRRLWRRKPALRLYDLYAALGTAADREALARLVQTATADLALLARATRWADPTRPIRPRIWRTIDATGAPLGIYIAPA